MLDSVDPTGPLESLVTWSVVLVVEGLPIPDFKLGTRWVASLLIGRPGCVLTGLVDSVPVLVAI